MKRYVKPDMLINEFALNDSIAVCVDTTETKWNNQTINCIVNGSETIFYDDCTNSASNGKLVYYDGTGGVSGLEIGWYYVWSGSTSGRPSDSQQTAIDTIMGLAGVSGPGWHAGPASAEIITVHNMS